MGEPISDNGFEPYIEFHSREMLPVERVEIARHAARIWRRPLYGTLVLLLGSVSLTYRLIVYRNDPAIIEAMPVLSVSLLLGWVASFLMLFYFFGSLRDARLLRRDVRSGIVNIFVHIKPPEELSDDPDIRVIEVLPNAERQWSVDQEPVCWRRLYPARVHDPVLAD